jgi:2-aminoadipate transaminase
MKWGWVSSTSMSSHLEVYRERRDVMLESLEEHMPSGVRWTHPKGGLFLWATLPETLSSVDILEEAVEQKVAFVPGFSFFPTAGR